MAGKKRSAADSLAKLSRGLTGETPATRAVTTEEPEGSGGEKAVDSTIAAPAATGEPVQRRTTGRPRTKPQRMVQVSVDLPRPDHKYLWDFAYDAESDGMSVMRALLQERCRMMRTWPSADSGPADERVA